MVDQQIVNFRDVTQTSVQSWFPVSSAARIINGIVSGCCPPCLLSGTITTTSPSPQTEMGTPNRMEHPDKMPKMPRKQQIQFTESLDTRARQQPETKIQKIKNTHCDVLCHGKSCDAMRWKKVNIFWRILPQQVKSQSVMTAKCYVRQKRLTFFSGVIAISSRAMQLSMFIRHYI